jgi:peroxiredoxin
MIMLKAIIKHLHITPESRPLLKRMAVMAAFVSTMVALAAMNYQTVDYQTVDSWSHQRELMIARGMSEAEADSSIARSLIALKALDRSAGNDRIGVAAPPFQFDGWINTNPMTLQDLRGKVVLVRWWTDTCPYCASSAPALRKLHETYSDQGLTIIGVFHPKAGVDDPLDVERVQRSVDFRRFRFPVAIDWDWRTRTLRDWWLTGPEREATSVTFLLDKAGVIQFVHPGMEYHHAEDTDSSHNPADHAMCVQDMATIETAIVRLLAE